MRLGCILKIAAAMFTISILGSVLLVLRWDQPASTILYEVPLYPVIPISVFIGLVKLSEVRSKAIVQKWAAKHGCQILRIESPFRTGGFSFWTTSQGQVVYSITVREDSGCERKAWVRCGSYFGGVHSSEEIEVKWQTEPDQGTNRRRG
jgi:hypothetical protein